MTFEGEKVTKVTKFRPKVTFRNYINFNNLRLKNDLCDLCDLLFLYCGLLHWRKILLSAITLK